MSRAWKLVILCLLLGALTTACLSAVCSALLWPGVSADRMIPQVMVPTEEAVIYRGLPPLMPGLLVPQNEARRFGCRWTMATVHDQPVAVVQPPYAMAVEVEAGWPLYAFRGQMRSNFRAGQETRVNAFGNWRVVPRGKQSLGDVDIIPWGIVPIGFVVDTLIFAAAWWVAFTFPAWLRARRRARIGKCSGCGYDRRATPAGSACPECGIKP